MKSRVEISKRRPQSSYILKWFPTPRSVCVLRVTRWTLILVRATLALFQQFLLITWTQRPRQTLKPSHEELKFSQGVKSSLRGKRLVWQLSRPKGVLLSVLSAPACIRVLSFAESISLFRIITIYLKNIFALYLMSHYSFLLGSILFSENSFYHSFTRCFKKHWFGQFDMKKLISRWTFTTDNKRTLHWDQ